MNVWRIIKITEIVIFLAVCSVQDIKEKKLSVRMLAGFSILFFISSLFPENILLQQRACNMLPGAIALLIAFLTREQIGYGDGVCMLILGNIVSYSMLLGAIMGGLILLCCCSVVLLVRKKAAWKTTLPFLPFLMIGMVIQMAMGDN